MSRFRVRLQGHDCRWFEHLFSTDLGECDETTLAAKVLEAEKLRKKAEADDGCTVCSIEVVVEQS